MVIFFIICIGFIIVYAIIINRRNDVKKQNSLKKRQDAYEYFEKQRKENPESQTAKECIECQVAGTFYRTPKEKKRAESLGYKENLYLEPEPENPYDNNAIKIETYDGFHIGYIPSYLCEDVLAFIEKYPDYKVTVEEVREGSSSPFIDIKITY